MFLRPSGSECIGHRGAPRELPENTIPGFLRAIDRGANAVELDVHRTRDGIVVVHHDDDIVTAAGTRAPIISLTGDDIAHSPLPGGLQVPTLTAVLDAIGDRATVYIELKGEGVADAAVDVAIAHGSRFAFHSFRHEVIRELAARVRPEQRGVLFDEQARDDARRFHAYDAVDLWAHWSFVDAAFIAEAHSAGKRVMAWTVNSVPLGRQLLGFGIDGICTDDVRLFEP